MVSLSCTVHSVYCIRAGGHVFRVILYVAQTPILVFIHTLMMYLFYTAGCGHAALFGALEAFLAENEWIFRRVYFTFRSKKRKKYSIPVFISSNIR
jgi:hypothetical protein